MDNFTPVSATLGGMLIGTAALLVWVMLGRIVGISGIIGTLPSAPAAERGWRLAFLIGLVAAPALYGLLAVVPRPHDPPGILAVLVGGFLVGLGTRLGGGCTSGHGVCGLARLSPRSIAATAMFMGVAAATVFVARHLA